MQKVNLAEKLAQFSEQWKPKIVGELNGQQVKLVKFQGPFVWRTLWPRSTTSARTFWPSLRSVAWGPDPRAEHRRRRRAGPGRGTTCPFRRHLQPRGRDPCPPAARHSCQETNDQPRPPHPVAFCR